MLASTEWRLHKCPHCRTDVRIHRDEGDAVDCTCRECGNGFTCGEARRGKLAPDPSIAQTAKDIAELRQELADEREIVRSQGDRIADLGLRLSSMQGRFAALAAVIPPVDASSAHTVEVGTQQPTMRMRLQHSHTLKEGWRLSEATVEWSGVGDPDEAAIEKALLTSWNLGQREAVLRNAPQSAMTDGGDPS